MPRYAKSSQKMSVSIDFMTLRVASVVFFAAQFFAQAVPPKNNKKVVRTTSSASIQVPEGTLEAEILCCMSCRDIHMIMISLLYLLCMVWHRYWLAAEFSDI